jgi:hypothetical protein
LDIKGAQGRQLMAAGEHFMTADSVRQVGKQKAAEGLDGLWHAHG